MYFVARAAGLTCLKSWYNAAGSAPASCRAYSSQTPGGLLRVCVVGSGPAGLYSTDRLLKAYGQGVKVDLLNVLHQFSEVIKDSRCQFFGNVTVGQDVGLPLLHSLYHATLPGVLSAREFVWWYNGHPDYKDLRLDLTKVKSVAICGLGNVAVDCARVLLQPAQRLASTDIAQHALTQLQKSAVTEVHLIGRRGPVQAAFTPKELREILDMPGVQAHIDKASLQTTAVDQAEMKATRMKRRVYDILAKAAEKPPQRGSQRQLHIHFLRSPARICKSDDGKVSGVDVEVNKLHSSEDGTQQRAVGLGKYETIPTQLVLESIGYMSHPLDGVPFDSSRGIIPNRLGKVTKSKDSPEHQPGLYACGWVKRGPTGIIGTNLWDAQQTVDSILEDFPPTSLPQPLLQDDDLYVVLRRQGVKFVNLQGYLNIDTYELNQGQKVGKPREKVVSTENMLRIADCH